MSQAMSLMSCVGAAIWQQRDVPFHLEEFVERHEGRYHDIQVPLPMRLI
jgi:hypothetical protein